MPRFHAVIIDETGCEFGASCDAANHSAAREIFRDWYPECRRIEDVRTDEQQAEIQAERMYRLSWELDNDMDWEDD